MKKKYNPLLWNRVKSILFSDFRSKLKFGSAIDLRRVSYPNEAKIVIVGGGAQGMAIAYKLAKQKYGKDIVVIDQVLHMMYFCSFNTFIYVYFLKHHTIFSTFIKYNFK